MKLINAKCTDFIIRTFYNKKDYVAYYEFNFLGEKCSASEKSRLPLIKYLIKNNKTYKMMVNKKNDNDYICPYQYLMYKYYLVIAILLIVVPLLVIK